MAYFQYDERTRNLVAYKLLENYNNKKYQTINEIASDLDMANETVRVYIELLKEDAFDFYKKMILFISIKASFIKDDQLALYPDIFNKKSK